MICSIPSTRLIHTFWISCGDSGCDGGRGCGEGGGYVGDDGGGGNVVMW